MISGTYILTDTINNGFNTIVVNSYKNADVIVTGHAAFKNTNGNGVQPPTFPAAVLAKVKSVPDVAAAAGLGDERQRQADRQGRQGGRRPAARRHSASLSTRVSSSSTRPS